VESWSAPEANLCRCGHSIAAHVMTDDGTCGFCFCRRQSYLVLSRKVTTRVTGTVHLLAPAFIAPP
jgi:hypothetical protein